eukprot:TRINITY_DN479_c0_g1_i1.p1 TRINITY_DN479_c0_g1~~TRINITY_DN479_c0_g1_i1.p1  ORF type:complete len:384 (-),score=43.12 TRINITY_DN479_c0_g1_i1:378-1529(-)
MCIRDSINAEYGRIARGSMGCTRARLPFILRRGKRPMGLPPQIAGSTAIDVDLNPPSSPASTPPPPKRAKTIRAPSTQQRAATRHEHVPTRVLFESLVGAIELKEVIGCGSIGTVTAARWRTEVSATDLAVKRVTAPGRGTGTGRREVEALTLIGSHANIVRLVYWASTKTPTPAHPENQEVWIVMPRHHQTLAAVLQSGPLREQHARHLLRQLLQAVLRCHELGVLHRDIKPANLLLDQAQHQLVLTDFSHAAIVGCEDTKGVQGAAGLDLTSGMVTPIYRAPEVWDGMTPVVGQGYGTAVDLWAVGCVWAEMLLGERLLGGMTAAELAQQANAVGDELQSKMCSCGLQPEALDLMTQLLQVQPINRCSAAAALEHPYLVEL